jgi:type III secretion protein R
MELYSNPMHGMEFLAILSLIPIIVIMTTCFVKVSMVLLLTRDSIGVQQIPPNIVLYSLSLVLSFYIMGPVYQRITVKTSSDFQSGKMSSASIIDSFQDSTASVRSFLIQNSPKGSSDFYYKALNKFWTPEMMKDMKKDDLIVLIPAFMTSEITKALKIGFLIYLPSVIIDIVVSNILMAMGMMMMSPVTISLPIKLLLFVSLDGWNRIIYALLGSYKTSFLS